MHVIVIEYELTCPNCGVHKKIVPLEGARPSRCVHCFLPITRREVRRYELEQPLATAVGSEAWIG